MTLGTLVTFWLVSLMFVVTPGADWAYAISGGMRRAVTPAVAGLLLGHLLATAVVAAGVGALVASMPVAMKALSVIGSGYLLYLGTGMLRAEATPISAMKSERTSGLRWITKGICVSGLNPKVFLLFVALLPQFTEPAGILPIPVQIMTLGLVHLLSCGVVYFVVGLGAQAVLQTRPRAAQITTKVSGAAMILFAVILLTSRLV